jgi:pimeloyl-ACP methyl ester carboxylesterase
MTGFKLKPFRNIICFIFVVNALAFSFFAQTNGADELNKLAENIRKTAGASESLNHSGLGFLRIAHLVPDAPAVDVCLQSGGENAPFFGPVLKRLGVSEGLSYSQVTRYLPLPARSYRIRVVAPNAPNCDQALANLPDTSATLPSGAIVTLAATGDLAGFQLTPFIDNADRPERNKTQLRVIHASPNAPAVDVGLRTPPNGFTPVFPGVSFRQAAPSGGSNYLETDPIPSAQIAVRPAGQPTDVLIVDGVPLEARQRNTAFAIGRLADPARPLSLLVCNDNLLAGNGLLGDCEVFAGPVAIRSRLDKTVNLPEFGAIRYRAPQPFATGPRLVLYHGTYGGASHLAFREILPLLDQNYRVYVVDLPGAGESEKRLRAYNYDTLKRFVESFQANVVRRPSYSGGELILGTAVLEVAAQRPELIKGAIFFSPQGVRNAANPPSPGQQVLYTQLTTNDAFGLNFYRQLFVSPSLERFLTLAYFDDALALDAVRIQESVIAAPDVDRRFLAFSFVGGQIYRPFAQAANGVNVRAKLIFGGNPESPGGTGTLEIPSEFQAIRPDFSISEVPNAGLSVQREKPAEVKALIDEFTRQTE